VVHVPCLRTVATTYEFGQLNDFDRGYVLAISQHGLKKDAGLTMVADRQRHRKGPFG
jgi:hypothetical protein